jgi:hypothetical protein
MSNSHAAAQRDLGDARVAEQHHVTDPHGQDEIEAGEDRGRRWYHPRPQPRRRTDLVGINSTWWMALLWLIVIVVAVYPGPWW